MSEARINITKTRDITTPTYYVQAIQTEFKDFAYDEDRAVELRGHWRKKSFGVDDGNWPLDLEIGTGNGFFFAHRAQAEPGRLLVGLELKFKPLIQSIRRALKAGAANARIARYHANFLENLFSPGEINHVFVHHPDPWTKRSTQKHRLLKAEYLIKLHGLQKADCFVDFKTDSREYFFWALEQFKQTPYIFERYSENLHSSEWSGENFTTFFERMFLEKGQPIFYLRVRKAVAQ